MLDSRRKSNTGSSSLAGGGEWVDFRAARAAVSMAQVLELLGWRPVSRRGAQLRGPCPVHGSQSPQSRSFSVNLEKHAFRCFKPGCCSGNQLDLYAWVTRQSLAEAARELLSRTRS